MVTVLVQALLTPTANTAPAVANIPAEPQGPGGKFLTIDIAAADMFAYIRVNSTPKGKRLFPANVEVANCIFQIAVDHYSYNDKFTIGDYARAPAQVKPIGYVAAFHTHTLAPWNPEVRGEQLDFSRPGDNPDDLSAGDLSVKNRSYYGIQYVGAIKAVGKDAKKHIIGEPVMRKNMGDSMISIPVSCEYGKK